MGCQYRCASPVEKLGTKEVEYWKFDFEVPLAVKFCRILRPTDMVPRCT